MKYPSDQHQSSKPFPAADFSASSIAPPSARPRFSTRCSICASPTASPPRPRPDNKALVCIFLSGGMRFLQCARALGTVALQHLFQHARRLRHRWRTRAGPQRAAPTARARERFRPASFLREPARDGHRHRRVRQANAARIRRRTSARWFSPSPRRSSTPGRTARTPRCPCPRRCSRTAIKSSNGRRPCRRAWRS